MPLGKCCQRYSRTCEFIAKTGTGRNIHSFKVLGRGLKGFQNSTIHGRSLSDGIGNKTIVPKGVVRTLYQDLEVRRARTRRSVQLTQSNAECHRVVGRAVPWSLPVENREKAREGIYYSVCLHLTVAGTGSKGLVVTRRNREVLRVSFYVVVVEQVHEWSG